MKEADEVEGLASVAFALPLDVRYLDDLLVSRLPEEEDAELPLPPLSW